MLGATLESVLLYVDGVQVAVLRDAVGTSYVASLASRASDGDKYLCVQISRRRLLLLERGIVSLRDALVSPEVRQHFAATVSDLGTNALSLELMQEREVPEDWLPGPNLRLQSVPPFDSVAKRAIAAESAALNRTVLHLGLEPEEVEDAVIEPRRLATGILKFSAAVNKAYRRALAALAQVARDQDLALPSAESQILQVAAFAPGSFLVHLQSRTTCDIFGQSALAQALTKLDELAVNVADPRASLAIARENRGHLVTAYVSLLEFVFSTDTPIYFRWTTPHSEEVHERTIAPSQARAVYMALKAEESLSHEEIELVGRFTKLDDKLNTWRLEDATGKEFVGEIHAESGLSLRGAVLHNVDYVLRCREEVTEEAGTGREKTRLLLTSLTLLRQLPPGGQPEITAGS